MGPVGNCDLIDLYCLMCVWGLDCVCLCSVMFDCDTMDCRPPDSCVHRILQARISIGFFLVAPRKPRGLD